MNRNNNDYSENNKSMFKCPECGLNYEEKKWAEHCEKWCKENHSCNLDIIKFAVGSNQKN